MDMTQRKMIRKKAPLVLYLKCCLATLTVTTPCRAGAARCLLTSALCGDHQLTALCLVAGCAAADLVPAPASGARPRPGHEEPSLPHTGAGLGADVAQHWGQKDIPFFICTCPHVTSFPPTQLDSMGSNAHNSAVCSLA